MQPIRFDDYNDEELLRILSTECVKQNVDAPISVKRFAIKKLAALRALPNFGNAGAVQTMLTDAKAAMSDRMQVLLLLLPSMWTCEAVVMTPFVVCVWLCGCVAVCPCGRVCVSCVCLCVCVSLCVSLCVSAACRVGDGKWRRAAADSRGL